MYSCILYSTAHDKRTGGVVSAVVASRNMAKLVASTKDTGDPIINAHHGAVARDKPSTGCSVIHGIEEKHPGCHSEELNASSVKRCVALGKVWMGCNTKVPRSPYTLIEWI